LNFGTEIDRAYDYKEVFWRHPSSPNLPSSIINWRIEADNNTPLGATMIIPGQIANLYPELRTKDYGYNGANFYCSQGTFTYGDLLSLVFKHQDKKEYEQFTLGVQ
jgi:hypothetical protein